MARFGKGFTSDLEGRRPSPITVIATTPSTTVQFGANFKVIGKTSPDRLSYKGAFKAVRGTLGKLAEHISKGHPWMPALLDSNGKRRQVNANYAELLTADIDDGLTIEEALKLPFIANYCALAIESASSKPEHHKFRLVFRYAAPVKGWQTIRACQRYLIHHVLKVADPSCKDANRFYFGAPGREPFLLREDVTLPENFVQQALDWEAEQLAEAQRQQEAAQERRRALAQDNPTDTLELVRSALAYAPQRSPDCGNYSDCVTIAAGLLNEFGEATATSLLEEFIPPHTASGDNWNPESVVRGLARGNAVRQATLGAVFYLCQQNGWKFPKREWQPSTRNRQISREEWASKGFCKQAELTKAEQREKQIQKRMERFKTLYWKDLQRDFLLGKADIEYSGYVPNIDLGLARTHLIQGWLGAGKTHAMLRALAEQYPDKLIIWVTTRNGLLYQTLGRARSFGLSGEHYQDDVCGNRLLLEAGSSGIVTMSVDSFKSYAVGRVDWSNTIVVIDEFRSVRCEILKKSNAHEIFPQFEAMLRESGTLVVADAFLSDCDRAILKPYRGRDRLIYQQKSQQSPVKIKWIESITKDGLTGMSHEGVYLPLLDQFIEQGGRIAVAVDNCVAAKQIADYLISRGKRVKLICQETVETNGVVLADPDSTIEAEQIDCIVYTPTAQAGLDIQTPFDRGLLIANGVLSPCDMLQMLGRCRQCPEWYVSAPRTTGESLYVNLDGKQISSWGQQLGQTFDQLGINTSETVKAWSLWQEVTGDIESSFNSEYLRCLLEHYFESVETVTLNATHTSEWRQQRTEQKNQDAIKTLTGDADKGKQLISAQKAPKTNQEVWDIRAAKLAEKHPGTVNKLKEEYSQLQSEGLTLSEEIETIQGTVKLLASNKINRLRAYVLASDKDIDEKLLERLRGYKFVSFCSPQWKQYCRVKLFRSLNLNRLACAKRDGKVVAHESGFTIDSPIVAELFEQFRNDRSLKKLYPFIETKRQFWTLCCRTMGYFGFESCAKKIRVDTDELHPNGRNRDGSQRYSKSKPMHFSAWYSLEESGSKLQQALLPDLLVEIKTTIEREDQRRRDYLERQERERQEAEQQERERRGLAA